MSLIPYTTDLRDDRLRGWHCPTAPVAERLSFYRMLLELKSFGMSPGSVRISGRVENTSLTYPDYLRGYSLFGQVPSPNLGFYTQDTKQTSAGNINMELIKGSVRVVEPHESTESIAKCDLPTEGGFVFICARDINYEQAKIEIERFIRNAGNRRVYVSELAEELQIDIDLIKEILNCIHY